MERSHERRTLRSRKNPVHELPCISKESLTNINNEKSSIAKMRPTRRRIKWNSAVSDWDRKTDTTTTRIKVGIDLEELQFLGGVPLQSQEEKIAREENYSSMTDFSFMEGDHIDELEMKINRTYDTIKRITTENDDLDAEVEKLKEQNQSLRREIADVPTGKTATRKGLEQLISMERRMKKKVHELEKQCKLLKQRKDEIEVAKQRIRSEDGLDETKSYATNTSKSISTFVETEVEDEDIMIFSALKEDESDGESEKESESSYSEEEEEVSLGSFEGEKEMAPEPSESHLGDSLKELPYEPSIMNL